MATSERRRPLFKIWIEQNGKPILGRGGAEILKQIDKDKSISKAARNLEMSYRYVWNYLREIGKALGEPVIEAFRGGKFGGGGARLTELGKTLLSEYEVLEGYLSEVLSSVEYGEVLSLKISARNRLRGKVVAVEKEGVAAKVKVQIAIPVIVTALISREAVEDLNIGIGDDVEAVIKATEVMIAK